MTKKQHQHNFVEQYTGLLAQGFDRKTDEATLAVYLQKLADDNLLKLLIPKLSEKELNETFNWIRNIIHQHLTEKEYHDFFLKNPPENSSR